MLMQSDIIAYRGIGPECGRTVLADKALNYAMERCGIRPSAAPGSPVDEDEFQQMFLEWFYSGNWLPVKQGEEREANGPWAS